MQPSYAGITVLARHTNALTRHLHTDHTGTIRLATTDLGAVASTYDYFPFGDEANTPNDPSLILRYTGHERDFEELEYLGDMDYMHARGYSPVAGRFLSIDPINSGDPKKPQSWFKFGYALNNPLKYVDPDGAYLFPVANQYYGTTLDWLSRIATTIRGRGMLKTIFASPVPVYVSTKDFGSIGSLAMMISRYPDYSFRRGATDFANSNDLSEGIRVDLFKNRIEFAANEDGTSDLISPIHELIHATNLLGGSTKPQEIRLHATIENQAASIARTETQEHAWHAFYKKWLENQLQLLVWRITSGFRLR